MPRPAPSTPLGGSLHRSQPTPSPFTLGGLLPLERTHGLGAAGRVCASGGSRGRVPGSRGRGRLRRRAAGWPFRGLGRRKPQQRSRAPARSPVSSSSALSGFRSPPPGVLVLGAELWVPRGWGGVRGPGAQWVPGSGAPPPVRVRLLTIGLARARPWAARSACGGRVLPGGGVS